MEFNKILTEKKGIKELSTVLGDYYIIDVLKKIISWSTTLTCVICHYYFIS